MFMRYHGGAIGHQLGKAREPQAPPVAPEPITPLAGCAYDDEVDKEPAEDIGAAPESHQEKPKSHESPAWLSRTARPLELPA